VPTIDRRMAGGDLAFHQRPLGLFDQDPRVKSRLELLGQGTFDLSLGRCAEQAGHYPGIGLQAPASVSSQPRGSTVYTSRVPIGPPPSSMGRLRPERI
jgi:hypothetical protein